MSADTNLKKLLTTNELTAFLNVSKSTAYRLIERREIPFYKVGRSIRFDEKDVVVYLQQNRLESVDLKHYGNKEN